MSAVFIVHVGVPARLRARRTMLYAHAEDLTYMICSVDIRNLHGAHTESDTVTAPRQRLNQRHCHFTDPAVNRKSGRHHCHSPILPRFCGILDLCWVIFYVSFLPVV